MATLAACPTLRDWLSEQPFSLALSSCYFGFFAHMGALSALEEQHLIPIKISGASSGALAGTMWASGQSTTTLHRLLMTVERSTFWDPGLGLGLLKGGAFRATIIAMSGLRYFDDCAIPVVLSAFDCHSISTHTLSTGKIDQAVYASCAVPLLFQPIKIGNALYFDGGIKDWAGCAGLINAERVLQIGLYNKPRYRSSTSPAAQQRVGRENIALHLTHLTAVSPFSLQLGKVAFQDARRAMLKALKQPANLGDSLCISAA